jgi:hypothetical protein
MKPNLPDTHDHENTNHLACYSPSPGGDLSRLGSGERNLSRQSGTERAGSERVSAGVRAGKPSPKALIVTQSPLRRPACRAEASAEADGRQRGPLWPPYLRGEISEKIRGYKPKSARHQPVFL